VNFLIIDDHPLVRSSITTLLTGHFKRSACFESATAEEGIRYLGNYSLHVVLLDLTLPGMGGFAALKHIRHHYADTSVLILSASDNLHDMQRCLDAGAHGYVNKSEPSPVILSAVNTVLQGGQYTPPILQTKAGTLLQQRKLAEKITPRQREVLKLMQAGKSNREMAGILNISENTIKVHCRDLFKQMGVNNRHQAVQDALHIGVLD